MPPPSAEFRPTRSLAIRRDIARVLRRGGFGIGGAEQRFVWRAEVGGGEILPRFAAPVLADAARHLSDSDAEIPELRPEEATT